MKKMGRKLLLAVLALAVLAGLAVFAAAAEPDYCIDSIALLDTGFKPLQEIPADEFYVEVSVTNLQSEGKDALMVGTYAENGRMLSLSFLYAKSVEGQTLTFGTTLDNREGEITQIRAFMVDAEGSLRPLAHPAVYPAEKNDYVLALESGAGSVSVLTSQGKVETLLLSQPVTENCVYRVAGTAYGYTTLQQVDAAEQSYMQATPGSTRLGDYLVSGGTRIAVRFVDGTTASYLGTGELPVMVWQNAVFVMENGVARAAFCPDAVLGSDVTVVGNYYDQWHRPGVQYIVNGKTTTIMDTPDIVAYGGVSLNDIHKVVGIDGKDLLTEGVTVNVHAGGYDPTNSNCAPYFWYIVGGTKGSTSWGSMTGIIANTAERTGMTATATQKIGTNGDYVEIYWDAIEKKLDVIIAWGDSTKIASYSLSSDKKTITVVLDENYGTSAVRGMTVKLDASKTNVTKATEYAIGYRVRVGGNMGEYGIFNVIEPDVITAKSTGSVANSSGRLTTLYTDGRTYTVDGGAQISEFHVGTVYDLYMDPGGTVFHAIPHAEPVAAKYLYVLDTAVEGSSFGGNTYLAKVLFEDGSVEIIETNKDMMKATGLYAYIVKGDVYTLTVVDDTPEAVAITRGQAVIGGYYANDKTSFVVETMENGKTQYTVYIGINNVPSMMTDILVIEDANTAGLLDIVYCMGSEQEYVDTTTELETSMLYVPSNLSKYAKVGANGEAYSYYSAKAWINGAAVTVKLSPEVFTALKASANTVNALELIRGYCVDDNGVVTAVVSEMEAAVVSSGTADWTDGIITLNGTPTYVKRGTPVYFYERKSSAMEEHTIEALDDAANKETFMGGWYLTDANGNITAVYGMGWINDDSAAPEVPVVPAAERVVVYKAEEVSGVYTAQLLTGDGTLETVTTARLCTAPGVYTVDAVADGVYTLSAADAARYTDVSVTTGRTNVGDTTVYTYTQFLVESAPGKFDTYTGIHTVPSMVAGSAFSCNGVFYCLDAQLTAEAEPVYPGVSKTRGYDQWHRPGWSCLDANGKEIAFVPDTPDLLANKAIRSSELYRLIGNIAGADLAAHGVTLTVRTSGYDETSANGKTYYNNITKMTATTSTAIGSTGDRVEVYWDESARTLDVLIFWSGAIRIADVTVDTAVGTTTVTTSDASGFGYGTLKNLSITLPTDETNITGANIGDVCIASAAKVGGNSGAYQLYDLYLPTVVTGVSEGAVINSSNKHSSLYMGGKTYTCDNNIDSCKSGAFTVGETFDVYLDEGGIAHAFLPVVETAAPEYAYVIAVDIETASFAETTYLAQVLLTDGTVKVVKTKTLATTGQLCTYTVNSKGVYTLTKFADTTAAVSITRGQAVIGSYFANSKTVFVVETMVSGKAQYNVYTGIQNVPSMTTNILAVKNANTAGLVDIVYCLSSELTPTEAAATNYLYLLDTDVEASTFGGNTYLAKVLLADSTVEIIETDRDLANATGLYSYKVANEVYTLTAVMLTASEEKTITRGEAVFGNTNKYFDDKTVFVVETTVDGKSQYDLYVGIQNVPTVQGEMYYAAENGRGAVVFAMNASEVAETVESGYLYVLAVATEQESFAETTYLAQVLLTDGTVEVIETRGLAAVGELCAYTVNSKGVYTLERVDDTTESVSITAGQAVIGSYAANDSTVFVVETMENGKAQYNAYTGIRNVPTMNTNILVVENAATAGLLDIVYCLSSEVVIAYDMIELETSMLYVPSNMSKYTKADADGNGYSYYSIKAWINGKATTVKLSPEVYAALKASQNTVNALELIRGYCVDDNGVVTAVAAAEGATVISSCTANWTDGIITVNGTPTYIAEGTPLYLYERNSSAMEKHTIEKLDGVSGTKPATFSGGWYLTDANGNITAVYGMGWIY